MRQKGVNFDVQNALQVGTDTEGGYLVPDEFERTLVDALQEQNIFRQLAHVITTSTGDKIPWSPPTAPRPGLTRRARTWRATTPSARCPSARTSWAP